MEILSTIRWKILDVFILPIILETPKKRKDNKTGINGVRITEYKDGSILVRASYYRDGKEKLKSWSLSIYTLEEAIKLGVQWRSSKLKELEASGIAYSERHGK